MKIEEQKVVKKIIKDFEQEVIDQVRALEKNQVVEDTKVYEIGGHMVKIVITNKLFRQ